MTTALDTGKVGALHRFPVKSMLGETPAAVTVGPRGVLGDRAYAVVDADGVVATAKVPRRWGGLLEFRATYTAEPEPGLPLPPVDIRFPDGSTLRSDDRRVHTALSEVLGTEVRLSADPQAGQQFEEVWPDIEGLAPQGFIDGTRVGHEDSGEARSRIDLGTMVDAASFFDLATLHVMTRATLDELARLAPTASFDPRRYRPNILLDVPGDGFVEDAWVGRTLVLGDGVGVAISMLTMRCVMTTLAQDDLHRDADSLRAIARHHRREIPQMGAWACAGVYAEVVAGGTLNVGDVARLAA